jgi:3-phenylpropionate/cinnamic acid dioxygenase small subunit
MSTTNGSSTLQRISEFLIHEAALLDGGRYDEWLDLLHDDFRYSVPVPMSREDPYLPRHDEHTEYANESKSFLQMRFSRIGSDYAWSERPPAFTRHFVSNVRMVDGSDDAAGRWEVAANVLVVRARLPEEPVMSTAERRDVIVDDGGQLRLLKRSVYLDTEIPNESQLGVIY